MHVDDTGPVHGIHVEFSPTTTPVRREIGSARPEMVSKGLYAAAAQVYR